MYFFEWVCRSSTTFVVGSPAPPNLFTLQHRGLSAHTESTFVVSFCHLDDKIFFSFFLLRGGTCLAPSRTSAEACLTGRPNVQPQGWDKCIHLSHPWGCTLGLPASVALNHQACLTVCVKCRCCATSFFSRNGRCQPACLQTGQSPPERVGERERGVYKG